MLDVLVTSSIQNPGRNKDHRKTGAVYRLQIIAHDGSKTLELAR